MVNLVLMAETNQVLVIKMVGYIAKEMLVEGSGNFDINMQNETLKEMVVVGYGSQSQKMSLGQSFK